MKDAASLRSLLDDQRRWRAGGDPHSRQRRLAHRHLLDVAAAEAPPPGLLLDLGGGEGSLVREARSRGYAGLSVDLAGTDARGDFEALPVRSGAAAVVAFSASLHYAESIERALGEAARVLRPDGLLLVTLTPVHDDPSDADVAAATTRRAIARAGGTGPLASGYAHLTWARFAAALVASGFSGVRRIDAGLPRSLLLARALRRALLRAPLANFPLVIARKAP